MKRQDLCISFALLSLLAVPAHSQDIYRCDVDGRVTYSNVPTKNCRKIILDPVNLAPAARPAPKASTQAPTPGSFPKVDDQTQKSRDTDRRRILESELAAEQASAEQAKKDLAEQEATVLPSERVQGGAISGGKVQERIKPYQDKVSLHQRNIEAIKKEIGNLR